MSICIEETDASEAKSLVLVFNRHIRAIPYEPGVGPDNLVEGLERFADRVKDSFILVAKVDGEAVGYLQAGVTHDDGSTDRDGIIQFLGSPRRNRAVGQALLDSTEARFFEKGIRQVRAFDYRYNNLLCWYAHLKSPWEHIEALLGANGYREDGPGSRIMYLDEIDPTPPDLDRLGLELSVEEEEGFADLPNILVKVWRGSQALGACHQKPLLLRAWENPAGDICYTAGMGVTEDERGKGIGRLLMAASLSEMYRRGYRRALLDVANDNPVALMLYTSMGYRQRRHVSPGRGARGCPTLQSA